MEEMAKVADLAERLRRYFGTPSLAYSFFAFGAGLGGYWLAAISLKELLWPEVPWGVAAPVAALAMWAVVALCVIALQKRMPKGSVEQGPREGLK